HLDQEQFLTGLLALAGILGVGEGHLFHHRKARRLVSGDFAKLVFFRVSLRKYKIYYTANIIFIAPYRLKTSISDKWFLSADHLYTRNTLYTHYRLSLLLACQFRWHQKNPLSMYYLADTNPSPATNSPDSSLDRL
ncbi:hypothetical protein, partial [Pseudomonas amygdali]|uniref:hypothetical protein n=1 Tax=Pseudomonas amygdali TaxID=47877 RepID=UPI001FB6F69E